MRTLLVLLALVALAAGQLVSGSYSYTLTGSDSTSSTTVMFYFVYDDDGPTMATWPSFNVSMGPTSGIIVSSQQFPPAAFPFASIYAANTMFSMPIVCYRYDYQDYLPCRFAINAAQSAISILGTPYFGGGSSVNVNAGSISYYTGPVSLSLKLGARRV